MFQVSKMKTSRVMKGWHLERTEIEGVKNGCYSGMRYNSEVCPWNNNLVHERKFTNYSYKSLCIDNDACKPRNHKYVCPKFQAGKWQKLTTRWAILMWGMNERWNQKQGKNNEMNKHNLWVFGLYSPCWRQLMNTNSWWWGVRKTGFGKPEVEGAG